VSRSSPACSPVPLVCGPDALDFLADAASYAVALAVVGRALHWRARAALLIGGIMGLFGLWVAAGTLYHSIFATMPDAG
jgi:hypothetical protein